MIIFIKAQVNAVMKIYKGSNHLSCIQYFTLAFNQSEINFKNQFLSCKLYVLDLTN